MEIKAKPLDNTHWIIIGRNPASGIEVEIKIIPADNIEGFLPILSNREEVREAIRRKIITVDPVTIAALAKRDAWQDFVNGLEI